MDKSSDLRRDVERLLAKNSERTSFTKLIKLLMLIREWKALLSSSDFVQAMRQRQRIAMLINELLQLQCSMPLEYADIFYRFIELEVENIREFEAHWAALVEHQISPLVSKLKLSKNRR